MKANELRIGNYVYRQSGKMVVNRDSVYQIENVNLQSALKYEPIPLTEDWLIKFGFEKSGIEWLGRICLEDYNNEIYYSAGEGVKLSRVIKYVHDLQNLTFALTGEELSIKD